MGAYQNQRFNSKNIASRIILEAIAPKFYINVDRIAEEIVAVVDPIIDNFFFELASYMGEPIDLAGQGIPGTRPWNALTLDWIKRKGNDLFFSYTHSLSSQTLSARLKGKSRRTVAFRNARNSSLITTFERLRGVQEFGGTVVRVISKEDRTVISTVSKQNFAGFTGKGKTRKANYETSTIESSLENLAVLMEIRLWSKFSRAKMPRIESALGAGGLGMANAAKLIGHNQQRPLIRPFMAYYSTVVIPRAIEEHLSRRFKLNGTFKVLPP